ncbi:hypothetical protein V2J09_003720 [Rumex salicifolius]
MESQVSDIEPLPPSLLAMRLKWDVFLSFRGEDTRQGFTKELYTALGDSGIRTFIDNEGLKGGDAIDPSLNEAILDSAAAIAVISPRYADSHWCLEELARLFQCRKLVVPVFYRVDPSHVRSQTGDFEVVKGEHSDENVQRWKQALTMAGGRSGHVISGDCDESHTIKTIVARISTELRRIPIHVAAYPVGLGSRVDESNRVRFLGIHGHPGIGKTTLAKAVFSKLVANFKRSCFISNFKQTLEKEDGVITLLNKLLSDLSLQEGHHPNPIDDVNSGKSALRRLLCNEESGAHDKRVLVVLDDVVGADELEAIGIHREWFSEGSRILATSSEKEILLSFSCEDELYEAKELLESEALELFSYHSLRRKEPTEEFLILSKEIVSWTGGLPLAIEVFGSMLLDKRTNTEWEKYLQKWRQIRPSHLQDVLKLSYAELDDEHKCIFLDISCLFVQVGMKKAEAIDIINGCGFTAEEAIQILMKKSLLKITQDDVLWMHDQIRDMGRQIVIGQGVNRSRLWSYSDILHVLKNKIGIAGVRGIILDTGRKRLMVTARTSSLVKVWRNFNFCGPEDSGINMKSFQTLKLLQINGVKLNYIHMPAELRWLKWKGCPWKSLPSSLPPEIRVLDLSESKLECLWSKNQVVKNLTVFNLSNSYHLSSIPDLSRHCAVKKLILEGCVKLNEIDESLGHMTSLVHLNLRRCTSLTELPTNICGLKRLEELILSECRALSKLPSDFTSQTSLRELHLDYTAIKQLPSLFHLTRLQVLMLNHCIELKCLPKDIGNLRSLKILSLSGSGVEELPDSLGDLECLEQLKLEDCPSLKIIPNSVGKIKLFLQILRAKIGGLSSIVEIHLDGSYMVLTYVKKSCKT